MRKTTEQFIEKANKIHNNKYDYSKANYINAKTKVCIICPVHGEFWQTPDHHLNKKAGCSECAKLSRAKKQTKTIEQFIKDADLVHNNKYDYSLVDYKNSDTKIKIICPIHGVFEQAPNSHLSGCGCPECKGGVKLTTEQFIEKAKTIHGDKYDYDLTKYINAKNNVKIICPKHGLFEQNAHNHLMGQGCPKCKSSHGEIKIRNYLKENNILFEEQKTFEDCKDINLLPFDFYLPEKNLLIEYQGEQHYFNSFKVEHYKWLKYKHHDWLKRRFARNNNIKLLTVSYKEDIINSLEFLKRKENDTPTHTYAF